MIEVYVKPDKSVSASEPGSGESVSDNALNLAKRESAPTPHSAKCLSANIQPNVDLTNWRGRVQKCDFLRICAMFEKLPRFFENIVQHLIFFAPREKWRKVSHVAEYFRFTKRMPVTFRYCLHGRRYGMVLHGKTVNMKQAA